MELRHHCIIAESAVKVGDKIQVFLPAFQDLLAWHFTGLAKNLAYIVSFEEDKAAYDFLKTSFTINTRAGTPPDSFMQTVATSQRIVTIGLLG